MREIAAPFRPSVVAGTPQPDSVAVVMCLWARPERLPHILSELASQAGVPGIRLVLWNNNASEATHNRQIIDGFGIQGAITSIEYHDSPHNILGMARFIVARGLASVGYTLPFVITLDDDQRVGPSFVKGLLDRATPGRVVGWWACSIHGGYWERVELKEDLARADYVGTGGAIWPVALVDDDSFFTELPLRYRMIEDLWASDYALRHGISLAKYDASVEFVLRERDQVYGIEDRKSEFYRYLLEQHGRPRTQSRRR